MNQDKQYGVILADPPWSYKNEGVRGVAINQYATMSDNDICELPVGNMAAANCILLLWATWPKLKEAMTVIDAWGFGYLTGIPWIKATSVSTDLFDNEVRIRTDYGVGFWARGASEPILIARKGNVSPPNKGYIGLFSPNLYHSRKPDSLYEYAESLDGPYLELFARRKRDRWDSWGNELNGEIEL